MSAAQTPFREFVSGYARDRIAVAAAVVFALILLAVFGLALIFPAISGLLRDNPSPLSVDDSSAIRNWPFVAAHCTWVLEAATISEISVFFLPRTR